MKFQRNARIAKLSAIAVALCLPQHALLGAMPAWANNGSISHQIPSLNWLSFQAPDGSGGGSPVNTQDAGSLSPFNFKAPDGSGGGRPNRRQDGGSRGTCKAASSSRKALLTAIVPERDNHSLTVDARPIFWFYVPYQDIRPMRFVLQDEDYQEIETVTLTPNAALPGIVRVRPASSLTIGARYNWTFSFECQVEDETVDEPVEFLVEGAVQRVDPSESLTQALENGKTARDRAAIYAQNGMWFDALALLGNLRQSDSGNADAWTEFLSSVGLEEIAQKPIVDCCRSD